MCQNFIKIALIRGILCEFVVGPLRIHINSFCQQYSNEILPDTVFVILRNPFSPRPVLLKIPFFNFSCNCACTVFNWVLLITKKDLRIAGFFALLTFLRCLCVKREKPSTHCNQIITKQNSKDTCIAGIKQLK